MIAVFGTPLAHRGEAGRPCLYYRVVGEGRTGWEFCFRNGRMYSAAGVTRRQFRSMRSR